MSWGSHIAVDPEGNWSIELPLPRTVGDRPQIQALFGATSGGRPVRVRSIRFAAEARVVTLFTLGFPVYWAILLAAPPRRRRWRAVLASTGLILAIVVISIFLHAADTIGSKFNLVGNDFRGFLLGSAEYLNVNVVPYLAPVLLALALDDELRRMIVPQPLRA